ncbi:hypothetical protein MOTE_23950 [Moorella thermoacetica]|uniref:Uncharacterized protein n=1 Tax=Neomoorella thermoacetica TaxID=1525 RepID=A0A1J5N9L2_NEOTH|nr:hypothetical protein MOTE_23950 [Moorella thermoacetica]
MLKKMKAGPSPPGDGWQDGVWLLAALILSGAGLWTVERGISWEHFRLFLTHFHFSFLIGAFLVTALLLLRAKSQGYARFERNWALLRDGKSSLGPKIMSIS